jgi:hypothetical protein
MDENEAKRILKLKRINPLEVMKLMNTNEVQAHLGALYFYKKEQGAEKFTEKLKEIEKLLEAQ